MNARPRVWVAAAAALCAAATVTPLRAAHAQEAVAAVIADSASLAAPAVVAPASAPVAPQAGPTLASASVAVRASASAADASQQPTTVASSQPVNAMPARNSQGQPKALMIVGGAAFITGALIGGTAGTAIMIGGAGVGLYGLYLYVQ